MRKITSQVVAAFMARKRCRVNNTSTNGNSYYLHGNCIAEWRGDELWITNAGWFTPTTKERLNGLPNVRVHQEDGEWFLNGQEWNGAWIKVSA